MGLHALEGALGNFCRSAVEVGRGGLEKSRLTVADK